MRLCLVFMLDSDGGIGVSGIGDQLFYFGCSLAVSAGRYDSFI